MQAGDALGLEASGIVVEVGHAVTRFAPGDLVMGLVDGAFSPLAIADHRRLVAVPAGWSFTHAASVPVAFATARYALVDLAGVQPGERVLVHAAAGGVGLAAVTLAQQLGAEVFATASPQKWDTLRALGLDDSHLASSRDDGFRDAFLAATGGDGMDVVLDALAGDLVDASLELLPRGGRFIEMGKTDIRDASEIAAAHPGVSYRAFDLYEAGPDRLGELLEETVGPVAAGELAQSRSAPGTCAAPATRCAS